jgi:hypothetical protein
MDARTAVALEAPGKVSTRRSADPQDRRRLGAAGGLTSPWIVTS